MLSTNVLLNVVSVQQLKISQLSHLQPICLLMCLFR